MNLKTLFSFLILSLFINCVGDPETVTISTPTIQCGMCQKAIERGLGRLKYLFFFKGVASSKVDLATKTASVAYYTERTDISTIEKTISSLGYQANEITADPNAYESLPACCKIGGMDKM